MSEVICAGVFPREVVIDTETTGLDAQLAFDLALHPKDGARGTAPMVRPFPLPSRLSAEELGAHRRLVEGLGAQSLWDRYPA